MRFQRVSYGLKSVSGGIRRYHEVSRAFRRMPWGLRGVLGVSGEFEDEEVSEALQGISYAFQGASKGFPEVSKELQGVSGAFLGILESF